MSQVKCGCWTEATFNKAANLPEEFTGVNLHDEKCIVPAAVEKIRAELSRCEKAKAIFEAEVGDDSYIALDHRMMALQFALAALGQKVEP